MKKVLLFISTVFLSLFLISNKTYAQVEEYPDYIRKVEFDDIIEFRENANTYEYLVSYFYITANFPDGLEVNEYFMTTFHNILLRKGLNRNTNSYVLEDVYFSFLRGGSIINIRVTLLKSFVNDNYPDDISAFFIENSALYVIFTPTDYSEAYNEGYNDGYDEGYYDGRNDGYNEGYDDGRNDGYNEGYDEGRNDGYNEGYDDGYLTGRNDGYNDGFDVGYNDGYDEGYIDGYQNGREDGERIGYEEGYNIGYEDGYNDGLSVCEGCFRQTEPILDYEYPSVTMRIPYNNIFGTIENENTYEFIVGYRFNLSLPVPNEIGDSDYYFVTKYHIPISKGIDRNTNSYEFYQVTRFPGLGYGTIELRITLVKDFITDENGSLNYDFLNQLLINDTALYVRYIADSGSADYNIGYSDGYQDGLNEGYNNGYSNGYRKGFDDGQKEAPYSFINNLHVWIVPAIIIVVIAGIFVGYRRERYHD